MITSRGDCETSLSHPSKSDDRHKPTIRQKARYPLDLRLPSDQAPAFGRQTATGKRLTAAQGAIVVYQVVCRYEVDALAPASLELYLPTVLEPNTAVVHVGVGIHDYLGDRNLIAVRNFCDAGGTVDHTPVVVLTIGSRNPRVKANSHTHPLHVIPEVLLEVTLHSIGRGERLGRRREYGLDAITRVVDDDSVVATD